MIQGLDFLYQKVKVTQRDLKPADILLNSKGEVKLGDFGVRYTQRGAMARPRDNGRCPYMAVSHTYNNNGHLYCAESTRRYMLTAEISYHNKGQFARTSFSVTLWGARSCISSFRVPINCLMSQGQICWCNTHYVSKRNTQYLTLTLLLLLQHPINRLLWQARMIRYREKVACFNKLGEAIRKIYNSRWKTSAFRMCTAPLQRNWHLFSPCL